MAIVILLIVALAVAYIGKVRDRRSYEIATLAVFGIAYFSVWPFLLFYLDVLTGIDKNLDYYLYGLLVLCSAILSLPWLKNISREAAWILAGIFFFSAFVSYAFDAQIENGIAIGQGYFDDSPIVESDSDYEVKWRVYEFTDGFYEIKVPEYWVQKKLDGIFTYFDIPESKNENAEMRLGCQFYPKFSIAEMASNIEQNLLTKNYSVSRQCFEKDKYLVCLVTGQSDGASEYREVQEWIVSNNFFQNRTAFLTFLFNTDHQQVEDEAVRVVNSISFKEVEGNPANCITTVKWM